MGNATFQIKKCFFKKCEYVILQQYAIGQIPKHFLKIEKIYMATSQYLVILTHVINAFKVFRLITYLNESSTIHVSY